MDINYTCTERFLKYVKIDTQSSHDSDSFPSTKKQKDLAFVLVEELKAMGITDAEIDDFGYVYATIPSNTNKKVPVICFCSHMDTSPDASGKDVKPVIHKNYQGGDIVLPGDNSKVIIASEHPQLASQTGNDIITTDGTTLLGADDKAGIAEIMDAANYLITHPEVKHGKIRILFTPDEEVGHGVDHVDIKKLGADFGYTMDGSDLGSVEDETFSGDTVHLYIQGFNIHPGFSKGRMENAIKIANKIIGKLPADSVSPESTEGRDGFIHPVQVQAEVDSAYVKFIVRDFDNEKLKEKEEFIKKIADEVIGEYAKASYEIRIEESYRNMKEVLDKNPEIMDYAVEAVERTGVKAFRNSIRGGTDGCRLSFMGLPCPNIFAGGHAFHSNLEWISVQDMEKAVETIIHLCMIWEERA